IEEYAALNNYQHLMYERLNKTISQTEADAAQEEEPLDNGGREAHSKLRLRKISIERSLSDHGDMVDIVKRYHQEKSRKLLIINVDAHHDKYFGSSLTSDWARILEESGLAEVIHMPSYYDGYAGTASSCHWRTERIRRKILSAIRKAERAEWEIWLTIDYDFFSLRIVHVFYGQVDSDREVSALTLYDMDKETVRKELDEIARFFVRNNVSISRIIPCESRDYLASMVLELGEARDLDGIYVVGKGTPGKEEDVAPYCDMIRRNILLSFKGIIDAEEEKPLDNGGNEGALVKTELLDVLDFNANPTGEMKPKELVHIDGDWHRTVHVTVINNKGKILIQRRALSVSASAGKWDLSVGGHVAAGENCQEAAIRELQEELLGVGVEIDMSRLHMVGRQDEHVKMGSPDAEEGKRDGVYYYKTKALNREFSTLFIYIVNPAEETLIRKKIRNQKNQALHEREASEVRAREIGDVVVDSYINPDNFGSTFKQYFGIPKVEERLSGLIKRFLPKDETLMSVDAISQAVQAGPVKNVAIVTPEFVPLFVTGGLGWALSDLATALVNKGLNTSIFMLRDGSVKVEDLENTGVGVTLRILNEDINIKIYKAVVDNVVVYLLDAAESSDRVYYGDQLRQAIILSQGSLLAIGALVNAGLMQAPEVIQANDWMASLVPAYLKTKFDKHPILGRIALVYTMHNLAYQGGAYNRFPGSRFDELGISGEHWFGMVKRGDPDAFNIVRSAIFHADILNTVSRNYSREILTAEYGEGLEGDLAARGADLEGIVNGATLPKRITELSRDKARAKKVIQKVFHLPLRTEIPLVGIISRLTSQKGVDLCLGAVKRILKETNGGIQFILVGEGNKEDAYSDMCVAEIRALISDWPENVAYFPSFDGEIPNRVFAGMELFIMSSLFEPCGMAQQMALDCGVPVVAHKTGGLVDTVLEYNPQTHEGNGFLYENNSDEELYTAAMKALGYYKTEHWRYLVQNAIAQDKSWDAAAGKYVDLFARAVMKKRSYAQCALSGAVTSVELEQSGREELMDAFPVLEMMRQDIPAAIERGDIGVDIGMTILEAVGEGVREQIEEDYQSKPSVMFAKDQSGQSRFKGVYVLPKDKDQGSGSGIYHLLDVYLNPQDGLARESCDAQAKAGKKIIAHILALNAGVGSRDAFLTIASGDIKGEVYFYGRTLSEQNIEQVKGLLAGMLKKQMFGEWFFVVPADNVMLPTEHIADVYSPDYGFYLHALKWRVLGSGLDILKRYGPPFGQMSREAAFKIKAFREKAPLFPMVRSVIVNAIEESSRSEEAFLKTFAAALGYGAVEDFNADYRNDPLTYFVMPLIVTDEVWNEFYGQKGYQDNLSKEQWDVYYVRAHELMREIQGDNLCLNALGELFIGDRPCSFLNSFYMLLSRPVAEYIYEEYRYIWERAATREECDKEPFDWCTHVITPMMETLDGWVKLWQDKKAKAAELYTEFEWRGLWYKAQGLKKVSGDALMCVDVPLWNDVGTPKESKIVLDIGVSKADPLMRTLYLSLFGQPVSTFDLNIAPEAVLIGNFEFSGPVRINPKSVVRVNGFNKVIFGSNVTIEDSYLEIDATRSPVYIPSNSTFSESDVTGEFKGSADGDYFYRYYSDHGVVFMGEQLRSSALTREGNFLIYHSIDIEIGKHKKDIIAGSCWSYAQYFDGDKEGPVLDFSAIRIRARQLRDKIAAYQISTLSRGLTPEDNAPIQAALDLAFTQGRIS
ncbi:MAG: glycogen/starch synthase, partial [Candidatus Omnitrophota bacterium]